MFTQKEFWNAILVAIFAIACFILYLGVTALVAQANPICATQQKAVYAAQAHNVTKMNKSETKAARIHYTRVKKLYQSCVNAYKDPTKGLSASEINEIHKK